jgi:transposase
MADLSSGLTGLPPEVTPMTTNTKAPKLRIVRASTEPLQLDRGERAHVGVDVHKLTYHVAVVTDRRGLIATWVQPASPEVLLGRLGPIRKCVAQVVYEAGPTGFSLVRRLRTEGYTAQVIAPSKLLTRISHHLVSELPRRMVRPVHPAR